MLHNIDPKAKAVHIETGNMLSMNNIMLKVWQSPVDEVRLKTNHLILQNSQSVHVECFSSLLGLAGFSTI